MIIPRSFFFLFLFPLYRQWRNSRVRMENPEIKFPSLRAASVEPEKLESGTFTFDELAGFPLRGRREIRRDKDDPLSRWNFRVVRKGTFNECRTMGTAGVDYPRLDVYLEKRDKRQTCCSGETNSLKERAATIIGRNDGITSKLQIFRLFWRLPRCLRILLFGRCIGDDAR